MGVNLSTNRLTRCGISDPSAREEALYRTWYYRFLVVFAVIAGALIVSGLAIPGFSWMERLGIVGSVGFLIAWFWFFGRWDVVSSDLHAVVYLVGNLVAVCIAISIWDTAGVLLFAAYWLAFAYLYTVPAIIYALALTISIQFAYGNAGMFTDSGSSMLAGVVLLLVITGFSGLMAKYIESFQKESERNKHLLAQLQATQASLAEREREAGVEQERHRVAGEIHDTIAQEFTSIITNLRAALQTENLDQPTARRHITLSLEAANQGLTDSRAMLATMQPDVLRGRSLIDALHAIAEDERSSSTATIDVCVEGSPSPLARSLETILVRSLQESLRNIRKHAQAMQVNVTLTWLEDEVLLDITDDGIGFDAETTIPAADGYHMGLATMRARVESACGTFAIESQPGEGTSVTISFPTGGTP